MSACFFGKTLFDFVQKHKAVAEAKAAVTDSKLEAAIFMAVLFFSVMLLYCVLEHAAAQKKKLYSFETSICLLMAAMTYISIYPYTQDKFLIICLIASVIVAIIAFSVQNKNVPLFAVAVSVILSYRSGNFDIAKIFSDIIESTFK